MKTIKEKILQAWAQDRKITVCFAMDCELTGYVSEFVSHAFEIRDTVRYTESGVRRFYYHDITDIRFVGEGHKEKAEGPEDTDLIYAFSPDDVPETVFEFSGKCRHADRCNQGKVESDTSADDVARQRWEWEEFATHSELYQIGIERDECGIATLHMASNEQKTVMEAAPEMLDALMAIDDARRSGSIDLNSADDENAIKLFVKIRDAIKKAEGVILNERIETD